MNRTFDIRSLEDYMGVRFTEREINFISNHMTDGDLNGLPEPGKAIFQREPAKVITADVATARLLFDFFSNILGTALYIIPVVYIDRHTMMPPAFETR